MKRTVLIKRKLFLKNEIIGDLYINDEFICNTLENKNKAIENGKYGLTTNIVSPKFKNSSWSKEHEGKVPRLINVNGRSGILIHVGNSYIDSSGCILVGWFNGNNRLINSVLFYKKMYKKILDNQINKIVICGKK